MTDRSFGDEKNRSDVSKIVKGNQQSQSKVEVKFTKFDREGIKMDIPSNWEKRSLHQVVTRENKKAQAAIKKVLKAFEKMSGVTQTQEVSKAENPLEKRFVTQVETKVLFDTVADFGPPQNDNIYADVKKEIRGEGESLEGLMAVAQTSMPALENLVSDMGMSFSSRIDKVKINGKDFVRINGSSEVEKGEVTKSTTYVTIVDDEKYSICFSAPEKVFDTYEKRYFNKMAGSIEIK